MSDFAIKVENLSKLYHIGLKEQVHDTLGGALFSWLKKPVSNFKNLRNLNTSDHSQNEDGLIWALRDVSFEVKHGEVLGIIGCNGAGKSTLLKILSRITEPTKGRAVINGRVGSLLEVGTGFHPELTGRENVYMNGTILGMKKKEIDAKFDEIVDFSGVEKFLDTPIKRYSSGMTVRLAFAVAAHLEPEILIVDEVLAVGDAEFQRKCLGKMQSISTNEGRTVLFVSHNMGAVQSLCTRAIILRQGLKVCDSNVASAVSEYLSYLTAGAANAFLDNPERSGDGRARLTSARVLNSQGTATKQLVAGLPATFEFNYVNPSLIRMADVTMTIYNAFGRPISNFNTRLFPERIENLGSRGIIKCYIPENPMPLGQYRVAIALQEGGTSCDHLPNAIVFEVVDSIFFPNGKTPDPRYCSVMIKHTWEHQSEVTHSTAIYENT
jgi:lipopolysaccharide transport system ATP-binding protein